MTTANNPWDAGLRTAPPWRTEAILFGPLATPVCAARELGTRCRRSGRWHAACRAFGRHTFMAAWRRLYLAVSRGLYARKLHHLRPLVSLIGNKPRTGNLTRGVVGLTGE